MKEIIQIFGTRLRKIIEKTADEKTDEIRLRIGKPLILIRQGKEFFVSMNEHSDEILPVEISQNDSLYENPYIKQQKTYKTSYEGIFVITAADVKETMEYACNHSIYAYEEELKQGYITIQGGHRIGVAGKVVTEGGKIKTIRNISAMNIRIAKEIKGCADNIMKYLHESNNIFHTLIVSPPGFGKTTLLRDIIRQFSYGMSGVPYKTVAVADERSEIAACYQGVAQNDLGIRTDVLDNCPKAEGMLMLLRSMAPDIIAVDELGTRNDIEAAEYIMCGGIALLASVHGSSVKELTTKPGLKNMISRGEFGRIIVINGTYEKRERFDIYDGQQKLICSC